MSEKLKIQPDNEKTLKDKKVEEIANMLHEGGYTIVELNDTKPWGAYFRIDSAEADKFIEQYFPGLSTKDARLGNEDAELSPKILLVSPGHRLSWQYHDRRAERWRFLTEGKYNKSMDDEAGEPTTANIDDVVQFGRGERHRLIGSEKDFTVVAEIWQHTDNKKLSDESDIVRLQDDYNR